MATLTAPQADLSLNYLLSFVKGSTIEYNEDHVPENVKYTRITPEKNIGQLTSSLYTVEFKLDVTTVSSTSVEQVLLAVQLPAQEIDQTKGDFFTWADLPAIKMINRIDIMFGTHDNVIESLTPSVLYLRLVEAYGQSGESKWRELADKFLGSFIQPVSYVRQPKKTVLLPILCDLFPLNVEKLLPDPSMRSEPVFVYFKIFLNTVENFCIRSERFLPANYVSEGASSDCALILQEYVRVNEPPVKSDNAQQKEISDFHVPTKYSFVFNASRSVSSKTDFVSLQNDVYINSLCLYTYNPYLASPLKVSTFYGHLCSNALENFINSFVYPASAVINSGQTVLRLRAGTLINSQDIIVQLVSTNTYYINYKNVNFSIVNANLDWANMPEEVLFDVGAMIKTGGVPVEFFKTLYFYVKPTLYEPTTRIPSLVENGRVGLLEGLFFTQDGQWAVFGFQNFDLRDTMTPDDRVRLKITVSQPVGALVSANASIFSTRKYCRYTDPLFMYADLDRTLKLGAIDIETITTNRQTLDTTARKPDWLTTTIQDFSNTVQSETLHYLRPPTYFSFGTRKNNMGYMDTVLNSFELNFSVGLFDATSNQQLDTFPKEVFTGIEFRVDFVYMLVRFLVYHESQVMAYNVNKPLYQSILDTFYGGVVPRHIDEQTVVLNHRMTQKRKRKARAVLDF